MLELDPAKVSFSSGSCGGGNAAFLADGASSYWQSSGSRPHWVEVEIGAEGWSELEVFLHEFGSSYEPETVKVEARVGGSLVTVGPDTFKIPKRGGWTKVAEATPEVAGATALRFSNPVGCRAHSLSAQALLRCFGFSSLDVIDPRRFTWREVLHGGSMCIPLLFITQLRALLLLDLGRGVEHQGRLDARPGRASNCPRGCRRCRGRCRGPCAGAPLVLACL